MGRQRLSGPEAVKVSFLLPPELNRQVEDLVARRKWDKSHVLRHLIELGLDAERRPEGSPTVAPVRIGSRSWAKKTPEHASGLGRVSPVVS